MITLIKLVNKLLFVLVILSILSVFMQMLPRVKSLRISNPSLSLLKFHIVLFLYIFFIFAARYNDDVHACTAVKG